eukprot:307085-Pyramimonas_sp.AAC.1
MCIRDRKGARAIARSLINLNDNPAFTNGCLAGPPDWQSVAAPRDVRAWRARVASLFSACLSMAPMRSHRRRRCCCAARSL